MGGGLSTRRHGTLYIYIYRYIYIYIGVYVYVEVCGMYVLCMGSSPKSRAQIQTPNSRGLIARTPNLWNPPCGWTSRLRPHPKADLQWIPTNSCNMAVSTNSGPHFCSPYIIRTIIYLGLFWGPPFMEAPIWIQHRGYCLGGLCELYVTIAALGMWAHDIGNC